MDGCGGDRVRIRPRAVIGYGGIALMLYAGLFAAERWATGSWRTAFGTVTLAFVLAAIVVRLIISIVDWVEH
jgi:hypothetical protein